MHLVSTRLSDLKSQEEAKQSAEGGKGATRMGVPGPSSRLRGDVGDPTTREVRSVQGYDVCQIYRLDMRTFLSQKNGARQIEAIFEGQEV